MEVQELVCMKDIRDYETGLCGRIRFKQGETYYASRELSPTNGASGVMAYVLLDNDKKRTKIHPKRFKKYFKVKGAIDLDRTPYTDKEKSLYL